MTRLQHTVERETKIGAIGQEIARGGEKIIRQCGLLIPAPCEPALSPMRMLPFLSWMMTPTPTRGRGGVVAMISNSKTTTG